MLTPPNPEEICEQTVIFFEEFHSKNVMIQTSETSRILVETNPPFYACPLPRVIVVEVIFHRITVGRGKHTYVLEQNIKFKTNKDKCSYSWRRYNDPHALEPNWNFFQAALRRILRPVGTARLQAREKSNAYCKTNWNNQEHKHMKQHILYIYMYTYILQTTHTEAILIEWFLDVSSFKKFSVEAWKKHLKPPGKLESPHPWSSQKASLCFLRCAPHPSYLTGGTVRTGHVWLLAAWAHHSIVSQCF